MVMALLRCFQRRMYAVTENSETIAIAATLSTKKATSNPLVPSSLETSELEFRLQILGKHHSCKFEFPHPFWRPHAPWNWNTTGATGCKRVVAEKPQQRRTAGRTCVKIRHATGTKEMSAVQARVLLVGKADLALHSSPPSEVETPSTPSHRPRPLRHHPTRLPTPFRHRAHTQPKLRSSVTQYPPKSVPALAFGFSTLPSTHTYALQQIVLFPPPPRLFPPPSHRSPPPSHTVPPPPYAFLQNAE
jgi:hypothetical protein